MVECILGHCHVALGSQLDKPKFSDNEGRYLKEQKGRRGKEIPKKKKKIP